MMEETNRTISRNEYQINPGFINEGVIRLGDGLDLSDPGAPKRRAARSPLNLRIPLRGAEVADYTLHDAFELREASSARAEAEILSAYFQGSYSFVSASAAYDRAVEERASSHSIYALLESVGQTQDIEALLGGRPLSWNADVKPLFEGEMGDDRQFRRQFLLDFGSHYVAAIKYGYRLAIRGRVVSSDRQQSDEVKAAFNAVFLAGGAKGEIDASAKSTLSQKNVELTFVATSGGLSRNSEPYAGGGVLTRLEDIVETLRLLRAGELTLRGAPIGLTARCYWNLLPREFTRSRALLGDRGDPEPPELFYGVPAGTVVAWHPTERSIHVDDTGQRHVIPPEGWTICNGEEGTPDLRDRFLMGAGSVDQIGVRAGAATHGHAATSGQADGAYDSHAGMFAGLNITRKSHMHPITVDPATVVPPHVKLVYIMKR